MHFRGNVSYTWFPEDKETYDRGNLIGVDARPGYELNSTIELGVDAEFAYSASSTHQGSAISTSNKIFVAGPDILLNVDKTTRIEGLLDFILLRDYDNGSNWILLLQANQQF